MTHIPSDKSKKIKYTTTDKTRSANKNDTLKVLESVTKMYNNRGFEISMYNGDNVFEMICDKFGEANVNIVGRVGTCWSSRTRNKNDKRKGEMYYKLPTVQKISDHHDKGTNSEHH